MACSLLGMHVIDHSVGAGKQALFVDPRAPTVGCSLTGSVVLSPVRRPAFGFRFGQEEDPLMKATGMLILALVVLMAGCSPQRVPSSAETAASQPASPKRVTAAIFN